MLSDSDSETNDLHTITVNEHFAKAFQHKKEREELAKRTSRLLLECANRHDIRHPVMQ